MTTFAELKTAVSRALRDPSKVTFTDDDLPGMINMSLAEIGRIAPWRFQEDITPTANTMEYNLLYSTFGKTVPEIEVNRVELWDGTATPKRPLRLIAPADQAYVNYSDTGWRVWDGVLEIPRWIPVSIAGAESNYLLRVWGYAPYLPLSLDADVVALSNEREMALITLCRVEGIKRLLADRDLFTQWQAGSNNSDVSPASLMNALSLAQDDWRRLSRSILVLREGPG